METSGLCGTVILKVILLIMSTIGNILVIIVTRREKQLRETSISIYIISLSIADLISNLTAVPYELVQVNNFYPKIIIVS